MPDPAEGRWLVAGLGNPGPAYSRNRHNIGFMVVDVLAARTGVGLGRNRRVVAEAGEGRLGLPGVGAGSHPVVIAKPMTYMNLSGGPIAGLAQFYKVPLERIIAVYDELDVPFGQIRIKPGGGEGGHNGVRSLARSLGGRDFIRIRFGIGRPPGRQDPADFVLSDFSSTQRKELEYLIDRAADAVEAVIIHGVEAAQNTFHAPVS